MQLQNFTFPFKFNFTRVQLCNFASCAAGRYQKILSPVQPVQSVTFFQNCYLEIYIFHFIMLFEGFSFLLQLTIIIQRVPRHDHDGGGGVNCGSDCGDNDGGGFGA